MGVRLDTWNIDQGADFTRWYPVTDPTSGLPINLTGWTAKAQIRPARDSSTLLHELTSAGGTILLGVDGKVTFKIAGSVSALWTWIGTEARFDCLLTGPTSQLIRMVEGKVLVSPNTTE